MKEKKHRLEKKERENEERRSGYYNLGERMAQEKIEYQKMSKT
jgi:hypothetical protein